jgi:hypothetical protein
VFRLFRSTDATGVRRPVLLISQNTSRVVQNAVTLSANYSVASSRFVDLNDYVGFTDLPALKGHLRLNVGSGTAASASQAAAGPAVDVRVMLPSPELQDRNIDRGVVK